MNIGDSLCSSNEDFKAHSKAVFNPTYVTNNDKQ